MAQSVTCIYPIGNISTPSDNNLVFSWSAASQKWNQVKYRKEGDDLWIDLGTVETSTKSRELKNVSEKLSLNSRYEWKVRVWDTSDNQSDWSAVTAFVYAEKSVATIGSQKLRVVELGKSEQKGDVRINLPSPLGICELDLTEYDSVSSSSIKIMSKLSRKLSISTELKPHIPVDDHSDVGYTAHHTNSSDPYGNHSNDGSTSYNNHSDNGGAHYGNHINNDGGYQDHNNSQGSGSHTNHTDGAESSPDNPTGHSDFYHTNTGHNQSHSDNGGVEYGDHYDNGSTSYDNHTDEPSSYANHIDQGSSKYSDHSDS